MPRSGDWAVLGVDSIADVFSMADVLAKQPRPRGPRLTIVTNAGGPGVLATDALVANGGTLASQQRDNGRARRHPAAAMEPQQSDRHPRRRRAQRYARALEAASKDPNSDGMLVILTPQSMTDPTRTAELLEAARPFGRKAALGKLDGRAHDGPRGSDPECGGRAHVPLPRHGRSRFQLHVALQLQHRRHLRNTTDALRRRCPDRAAAEAIVMAARQSGRTLLTEFESNSFSRGMEFRRSKRASPSAPKKQ